LDDFVTYCLAMMALGLCYAAQGPATLKLCEQTGIVKDVPGQKIDTKNLPELGLANALVGTSVMMRWIEICWLHCSLSQHILSTRPSS
jgi:hypothetical protein